jgi:hypothetical protein
MSLVTVIRAVLYELLPLRPKDAVKMGHELVSSVLSIASALKSGSVFLVRRVTRGASISRILVLSVFFGGMYLSGETWRPLVCVASAILALFLFGLDHVKREGLSAYSIFNRGQERLAGTITTEQLERQFHPM